MNWDRWQVLVSLWDSLSRRERLLLWMLGGVLLLLLGYFTVGGWVQRATLLEGDLEQQHFNLRRARQLKLEQEQLGVRKIEQQELNLVEHLEALSEQLGLRDQVNLQEVFQGGAEAARSVELRVDGLALDQVVHIIYLIESSSVSMAIRLAEVSRVFDRKDLLRLRLQVVGL